MIIVFANKFSMGSFLKQWCKYVFFVLCALPKINKRQFERLIWISLTSLNGSKVLSYKIIMCNNTQAMKMLEWTFNPIVDKDLQWCESELTSPQMHVPHPSCNILVQQQNKFFCPCKIICTKMNQHGYIPLIRRQ